MKITKEMLEQKKLQAMLDNQKGWLDTEKMNSQGIITSKPMCCTGYEPKENAFRICQQPKPCW